VPVPLAVLLTALALPVENTDLERIPTVAVIERIPLGVPKNKVALTVHSLNMSLELTVPGDPRALYARVQNADPQLCPSLIRLENGILLRCRTPRIEALLDVREGKTVLEIHELRGLPWREEGDQIWFFYNPIGLKFGNACPGDTPASRGECHFKAGRMTEAALEFRKGINTESRKLSALRLGDIALRSNDAVTAVAWYQLVGAFGPFGRMAQARLCELGGTCLGERRKTVFDATMLPEPLHTEMLLRGARAFAYIGAVEEAMTRLTAAMKNNSRLCENETRILCRQLIFFALQFPDATAGVEAIEAYLSLPSRTEGFLSLELLHMAAEKSAVIGAPIFAANMLAASVPWIEGVNPTGLNSHILRAAELYLIGGDRARARTLYEYAESRLGERVLDSPRWGEIAFATRNVDVRNGNDNTSPVDDMAVRDLASAYTSIARALRSRTSGNKPQESP
jgi:tetratricopeptide (TPR) repeat protein